MQHERKLQQRIQMYSKTDIIAKAWLVQEVVHLVVPEKVDKIFVIGSYANNKQTEWSDLDFLVQLKGGRRYPTWTEMQDIHNKLKTSSVHIIFGTEEAQESLHSKWNKPYKEIKLHNEVKVC
jgi:predicted nucleotidyltransferase